MPHYTIQGQESRGFPALVVIHKPGHPYSVGKAGGKVLAVLYDFTPLCHKHAWTSNHTALLAGLRQGRLKNEARILGKVILDTWRFILGYIAK